MHINTQLDENGSQKLAFLIQFTLASLHDVIQQAIDFYYEHTQSRFQQRLNDYSIQDLSAVVKQNPHYQKTTNHID